MVDELCQAGVELARKIGYDNAGTVEFLLDQDTKEWFFIEMNPRIQVEHTVTEQITGIDIVRSQILVAMEQKLHDKKIGIPKQENIPVSDVRYNVASLPRTLRKISALITQKFFPYRSAAGFGVRLDGAMGDTGSIITPFYDSLLVKLTTSGIEPSLRALDRMHRALREMRIRGVKTNIPFLENVITHSEFVKGNATTRMIDVTPSLFKFKARKDRF